MMNKHVSIIVLNWNDWKDTLECLKSLYQIDYPNYYVIILDNGSRDNSLESIKDYLAGNMVVHSDFFEYTSENKPISILEYTNYEVETGGGREKEIADLPSNEKLILIKNDKNYGFAEGNNIGIRYALNVLNPEYILLLNNDTIVDKNFLSELVSVAEADESIGFAGPKVYYYDFQGRKDVISVAGIELFMGKGAFHRIGATEIDRGQYDETRSVDYLEGSCLLIKRQVLDEIGLLNGDYFAYWEETDLCLRGAKAGYKSVYAPKSKIWHKVSSSSIGLTKLYYMTRNRLWFIRDNASARDQAHFLIYFFAYQFWLDMGVYLRRQDFARLNIFLKGVRDGIMPRHR
jgi:GT2 family glycosyltransferase